MGPHTFPSDIAPDRLESEKPEKHFVDFYRSAE